MKLLLDTHVLLWWLVDSDRVSPQHDALIRDPQNSVWVSSITMAEISVKVTVGKLRAPDGLTDAVANGGMQFLAFGVEHAVALGDLPLLHRDPFDRMLVAQAQIEQLTLLTVDRRIQQYDVLWR